ncbi:adhesin [Mesorhizobium sp. M1B.F.Ca.ET.045.04.1.1]|nr:adhesin [Mesorhizobium sp. M1B.F.Ca.ET.045.04.1.1]
MQQLGAGQSLTDSFTAVSSDGTASQLVTVTIHGTNDVPVIGGVSSGAVTEDVAVDASSHLNASGALTIADVDQGQSSFAAQAGVAGSNGFGTFTLAADGHWTYSADNSQTAIQQLGAGQSLTDSFTAVSSDGTASQLVTVTIHGTNDVPVIGGVSSGAVTEDVAVDASSHLNASGALTIADVDQGQSSFAAQAGVAGSNGFGTFTLAADGHWTYSADNTQTAIQQLGAGQSLTDSFTAVSSDGTASQLVTVTIHGTNDVPVIGGVSSGAVTEDVAVDASSHLNASGALTIADVDQGQSSFAAQAGVAGSNGFGTFTLAADGHWTYSADNSQTAIQQLGAGQSLTDSFTAVSSDGTASQLVTVTIHGTNDVPVIGGVSSGAVTEDVAVDASSHLNASGALTIADVDQGQSSFAAQAGVAGSNGFGTFTLAADGHWTYSADNSQTAIQQLGAGQSLTDSFTAVSSDGTASQLVTVTIHGTNDVPVIGGVSSGAVTEDVAVDASSHLNASGALTIADVDQGQSSFAAQAGVAGSNGFGTFTLAADGHWTYSADNSQTAIQQLGAGQSLTDSFTAVSSDGTASQLVTVTIHGTNDVPVIGGVSSGAVTEDVAVDASSHLNASGALTIADVDQGQSSFAAQAGVAGSNGFGTFTLAADGHWTYSADNSQTAIQQLGAGQSLTDSFTAVSSDGTASQLVTVTIHGTNDVPDIHLVGTGTPDTASATLTETNAGLTANGTLTVTDADVADTVNSSVTTVVASGITAGLGLTNAQLLAMLAVSPTSGLAANPTDTHNLNWTFNSGTQAFDYLAAGQSLTLTYTVQSTDNHGASDTQTITVTVNGTDEVSPTLISTIVDGKQGNNATPSTVTITFAAPVTANFVNLSDVMHVSGLPNVTVINGTGNFTDSTHYTFQVDKGAGSSNGSSYTLTIDSGAFSDTSGHTNASTTKSGLKPAGTAGEPINLALTDPSEGQAVTVTVKDLPSGWTIDGATQNADGSWAVQSNAVHELTVTTPADFVGAAVLDIHMTWTNADGTTGSMFVADNVEAYASGSPIFAWSGDDVLTGSSGNDFFVFSQPIGNDSVHSFDAAADQIDLVGYSGFQSFADVQAHTADDASGNAVIALGDGQSITLEGVHSTALGAGNFVFDQTPVVKNAGTMTIGDGALLPLSGTVNNSGVIALNSTGDETLLQVIQHGVTLEGGGQVVLSDSAANIISGTGPDVTLINVDNMISGAGQLGDGVLSLDNRGTIIASGTNALVIDTGGSVVLNSGTLEATGSGGLVVAGGVANSGMIEANGGNIVIHGEVTGDGDATIGNLSKLEFGAASSTDVTFAQNAAGTLELDDSFDYSGRISGITNDDKLDLNDILFGTGTTVAYQASQDGSGGTLTVSDGAHNATLHLLGAYDANGFKLADDGQGHTVVTYNPAEFTLTGVSSGTSEFAV